jgi:hypothetical protein
LDKSKWEDPGARPAQAKVNETLPHLNKQAGHVIYICNPSYTTDIVKRITA